MAKTKAVAKRDEQVPAPKATQTPMNLLMMELVDDLNAIRAKIPRLHYPHPRTTKLVRTYRSVPRAFVEQMNNTVKEEDEIRSVGTYDWEAGEAALDFVDNFRIFRNEVNGFLRGLNFTIELRHAEVAEKALQTYQIAKALRRRRGSNLGSHVTRLREALNRAGKKRAKKKEPKPKA
ncbi:MAG TPA: hypothetical protein VGR95_14465 [Thermoanaerobaculia bacterium]|jgi:hypothetical protein|nr:hypothetical protein [Thermoanaerobaculia bacterium]